MTHQVNLRIDRWAQITSILVSIALLIWVLRANADEVRLVPQHSVTSFLPISVTFHPHDKDILMVLNSYGRIDIFDIRNATRPVKVLEIPSGASTASFGPYGEHIITGGGDGTVRVWDAVSGEAVGVPLKSHASGVTNAAFSPDKRRIVSVGHDDTLLSTELRADGVPSATLPDGDRTRLRENETENGADDSTYLAATGLGFSPDKNPVVVSVRDDGIAHLLRSEGDVLRRGLLTVSHPPVVSVAVSPNGRYIVTGHPDGTIHLWDVENDGHPVTTFTTNSFGAETVAFGPSGKRIVAGAADGTVRFWNLKTRQSVGVPLKGHTGSVLSVTVSSDGKRIASCDRNGSLRLWHVEGGAATGISIKPHDNMWKVAFSPLGNFFVTIDNHFVGRWEVTSGLGSRRLAALPTLSSDAGLIVDLQDTVFVVEHVESGVVRTVPINPAFSVSSVAISRDGKRIVTGGLDGTVQLWDGVIGSGYTPWTGHENIVTNIAVSPNGTRIVTSDSSGTVRLWSVESVELWSAPNPGYQILDIGFSADGRYIEIDGAINGGNPSLDRPSGMVRLWDVSGGAPTGEPRSLPSPVALSPDGTLAVSGGGRDGALRLWDLENNDSATMALNIWTSAVEFSPDGTRIATGHDDGAVRLWDVERRMIIDAPLLGHVESVATVAFSPDGTHMVTGDTSGAVRLWHTESGRAVGPPLEGQLNLKTISPDGRHIVALDTPGVIRLWDTTTGVAVHEAPVNVDGLTLSNVAYSSVGSIVAVGSSDEIRLWHLENRKMPHTALKFEVSCQPPNCWSFDRAVGVGFSPDGDVVVSGDADGSLRFWAVRSGEAIGTLRADEFRTLSMAFSPVQKVVATGGDDGLVRLWDLNTLEAAGEPLKTSDASGVWSIAFSFDGTRIAFGSESGGISLWENGSRSHISSFRVHDDAVLSIAFSPDGKSVVSSGGDGMIRLWNHEKRQIVAQEPSCFARELVWTKKDVILVNCTDRFMVVDSVLRRRGELFPMAKGLIAVASGLGVYASPPSLKNHVFSFRDSTNLGVAESIPLTMMRQALFDDRGIWVRMYNVTLVTFQLTWRSVKSVNTFLGDWAIPVWLLTPWILAVLMASAMWVLFPSRLAWWSMSRAGRVPLAESLPLRPLVNFILAFVCIGRTQRPLKKWLCENKSVLESVCFAERDPVKEREKYLLVGHENNLRVFEEEIKGGGRGLIWIDGVGGSGKSALAMHLLRRALIGKEDVAIPVFVGEDWSGSLAAQIAEQLRHRDWTKGPSEAMVRVLGASGLICPLVDSLSERSKDAVRAVRNAVSSCEFKHVVVTSRKEPPGHQVWQGMKRLTPLALGHKDIKAFIDLYAPELDAPRRHAVKERMASLLKGRQMPSPLFLRFAVEQAVRGSLDTVNHLSLTLAYLEALHSDKVDVYASDFLRAAAIAAIESIQEELVPREISERQLQGAFARARNAAQFYDGDGVYEVTPQRLVKMLLLSGVIVWGRNKLHFTYDPVAEHLAAWWVHESPQGEFAVLRRRIDEAGEMEIGRAYRDAVTALSGSARVEMDSRKPMVP